MENYIKKKYLKIPRGNNMLIQKIWETKTGQKRVTIPKDHELKEGDYVVIRKVQQLEKPIEITRT